MNSGVLDGYKEIAQFAAIPDDERHRPEMLKLAQRLSGDPTRCAALLWLYDNEKERFHLDHHEPMEPTQRQSRTYLPCARAVSGDKDHFANLGYPAKINDWISRLLPAPAKRFFEVKPPGRGSAGFLAIHTASPLPDQRVAQLQALADVMAERIARHRHRRYIEVYDDVLTQISNLRASSSDESENPSDWFEIAAKVARERTLAQLAVVFRLEPDLSLRGIPASDKSNVTHLVAQPTSLIRRAFDLRATYRILNNSDPEERQNLFGLEEFDEALTRAVEAHLEQELRSWIAAAVVSNDQPVAVIFVANKLEEWYLPGVFSVTDQTLVTNIGKILSKGLVQTQTNFAIQKISNLTFHLPMNGPQVESARKELLETVRRFVPGIEAGAISLRFRDLEPAEPFWELGEITPGTMAELRARMKQPLAIDREKLTLIGRCSSGDPLFVYERELQEVDLDQTAVLHLATRREGMAHFEREVLKFLGTELGQLIRSDRSVQQRVNDLIQIRHALRSGLQGLRHIETACLVHKQLERGVISASDPAIKDLGTSLAWTRLFADRCRNLLEESRFLLGKLGPSELRKGGSSIGNLVLEIIVGLKPDADDRGIEFVFSRSSEQDDTVSIDSDLISIALFNLIDNAIKYSHDNQKVRLRLRVKPEMWTLDIEDTGVYIPEEFRRYMFQPFSRRPAGPTGPNRPGTGLGLAVVKQIVEAHQGTYDFSSARDPSRPDKAAVTIFTISIPRR